jgi:hypothetical protein
MEYFDAVRALALLSVIKEDRDYRLRTILRWYSKTFFTPLHIVEELPVEDVLRHYYETKYEELENEDLRVEIAEILETEEQKRARLRQEDEEKAENEIFVLQAEQTAKQKAQKKSLENLVAPLTPILGRERLPEAEIRHTEPPPPDIRVEFVDKKILDDEAEGFGIMGQPDE